MVSISSLKTLLALSILAIAQSVSFGQFTYSEDFKNSTAAGWVLNPAGNSTPNTILTSGAAPRTGDPETGGTIDPSGSGWLRLTNNTLNLHNAVYFDTPIPSAGNSVNITFGFNQWGGNNFAGTGADGLTFFLYDASKPFQVGADGGSLGYAQKTGVNGLNGGFVAVALDAYGNFSVASEGRVGGTGSLQPNSVSVRGPGQDTTGYNYLAGTGNRDYTDTGSPTVLDAGDGTVPALPYNMAFPVATARPNQSTQYRNVSITINESSQLLVSMQFGEDGLWYNLLNVDISSFVRPEQLKMGFSAGTGSGTIITEIGGLLNIAATAGSGNFVWDNRNGPGDSGGGNGVWGTATNDPLNWAGQTNPTLKSNVIFNSAYVSTPQTIDVTGSDKVITNMYFSGTNAYTLGSSEDRKLIFDSVTAGGLTTLNLTNDVAGNAAHALNLDVQMNQNLDINNNIGPTFTVTGNIDTGGNILGLKGTGTTELAGAIGGTGSLVKSDSGTTVLRGTTANTYTGTTTINGGTLQIEKASALGATTSGTTVNSGGTLALAGTGTTFDAEGLALTGTGVGGNGALRNAAGNNTWTGTVSLAGAGSNAIGVDGSTQLTVSGLVSGAAGNNLLKVGSGTLTLSGANTYAGSTTINAGTVKIGSDSNLGTAPGSATAGHLALDGGTLQTTNTFVLNANRGIALGAAGGTVNTDSATTLSYAGVIAGTSGGVLTKAGTGTLTLGGVSTYDGATNINAGTLRLGIDNALPTSTGVTIASGATLDVNSHNAQIGSLAGAGSTTLGTGNILTVSGAANTTYSGVMSGAGGLTQAGTGILTMSGANTFTGNLAINSGTVQLGASNVFSDSSTLVLSGGTFATAGNSDRFASLSLLATSTIDYNSMGGLLTFGNGSRTAGSLTISNWAGSPTGGGASQLLVDSASAFDAGFLTNITFTGYGTGAQILNLGGGIYEVVPVTGFSYIWGTDANGNWSDTTWAGGVTNPGGSGTTTVFGNAITADRTVTLDAARTAGYLVFNDNNSYTLSGASTLTMDVSGGNAQINVSGGGSPTIATDVALNDALAINQNSAGGTLTISGGISGTNQNITVGGSDNVVLSGVIATGAGTLTKNNSGTLTLSGANTFTGSTTVNGGTVSIGADNNLGTAPGAATPGKLALNDGTLQTTANFTLNANRGVALGASGGTFDTSASTTLTYGGIIAGSSGGALNKTGAGTLTLGGASTYDGATNINAGTVTLSAAERLPNGTAVTIAGSAVLNTNGFSETVGSIAGAGSLALGSPGGATTFTSGGSDANTTFSGVISGGVNAAFTKTGTGTLTLSGANTLAGNITVSAGSLNIQNNAALGTTAGRTTVNAGAALELQGGIAVGAEPLFLNGSGVSLNGALRSVSGDNSFAGALTLQTATTIKSEADTLTLTGGVTGTGLALTVAGAGNTTVTTSGVNTGTAGSLIKSGTGTLTLAASGNFTGTTTINTGTLEAQNAAALGTNAAGTTVVSGATLTLGGGTFTTSEGLSLAGSGVGGLGALRNLNADHTVSGNIALTAESYIGVASGTTLTASGVVSGTGFGLTKVDTGTLVLSGANSYTGTTAINAGTVQITGSGALGTSASPTTISSGATLAFNSLSGASAENITATGSGVGGTGAIQSLAGTNTVSGNVTLTGDTTVGVVAGTMVASGNVTGAYSLIKSGAGNLTLSGAANAYTGSTTVRNGSLTITTSAPVAANGALGNSGSTVQIGDAGTAAADNLALLIGNAAGGLSLDRAISVNNFNPSGATTLGGVNTSGTNTFAGNIGLGRDTTLVAAAGGTVNFSGVLSGTGPVTAGSAGNTGTVVLSNANSYTGATNVAYGTLVAANANALGTTAAAATVASGASLGVQGNITLPAGEGLTLNGSGAGGNGALTNLSGDNTVAGNIALASATTIGSQAGTMTISGVVSGGNALATTGAGDLLVTGSNTFTGATTIGGTGRVTLASAGTALGGTSGVTVNSGATLSFGADNQILNTADLSLAGGTLLLNGFQTVMRNVSLAASTSSLVDYLNDGSLLRFTGTSTVGASGTLTVDNWAGNPTTGGSGSYGLLFNTQAEALALENSVLFNGWAALGSNNVIANGSYWEIVPIVTVREWISTTGGNWDTNASWTGGAQPDARNAIALLGNAITAGSSASISTSAGNTDAEIVGKLIIDSTAGRNYTVNGTASLDFDASGSTQLIVSGDGQHTISAPVRVIDDLTITNDGTTTGTALTISGTLDLNKGTNSDLIVTGTGNTLISGAISDSTNGGAILKTGSGTLTLNGANSFTGGTTVRNGTLIVNNATATGSAAAIVVNDASTSGAMNTSLLIGTDGITLAKNITVNSQGAVTTLGGATTLTAPSDDVTFSGAISLGKTVNLSASGSSLATFSGSLSGAGGIDKVGTGTVTLSGTTSNSFTGNVDVKEGTLQLAKSTGGVDAIGATQGAIGDLAAVSLSGASSVLSINGPAAQTLEEIGSLSGVAGSNLNVAQATAFTLYTGNNNATTTFAGTLTDTGANLSLVKQGTGTMTLSGANAYDGATTVSVGTLVAANNSALGTATGSTTVAVGATLGLQGGITVTGEAVSLAATGAPSNASLANLSGNNLWTGTVSMTGATANDQVKFDASGGSQLTVSGIISEATNAKVLAKTGTGTIVLSGANTYTGSTNVAAGTLVVANNAALGTTAAGTSVQIGATLGVQGNVSVAAGETYSLYGTVVPPSAPSIKNIADTNTLAGNISLIGGINTGVALDSNTGSLTLSGAITQASNPNYVVKTGGGDLTLAGSASNTFTGGFTINDGTVIAAKSSGDATGAGNVNIGDSIGAANSATLRLAADNQINNSSAVTIQTDGRLDLQSFNDSIGALTMGGGAVQGTGTLTLGNTLTFNGVGSSTAAISANLDLGTTGTRIVQVGNNGFADDTDLTISGAIGGGTAGFNKTDLGTLQLSGTAANTFTGTFQVSDGTVTLNKTAGLNATGSGNISVGDGSGAANTANLKLLANNQIDDGSRVTVYGDGQFNVNGLTETIGSFAGAGTIATGTGGTGLLIAGGDNTDFNFSGSLTGDGTIKKVGTGTLTFDQSINFASGTLELNGGALALGGNNTTFTVGTLRITGDTMLDFGNSTATTLNATNVFIADGVILTIMNWVHLQDYFFANGLFQQINGALASYDIRGVEPQTQVIFDGWSGNSTVWQSWDKQITPAPEPATYGAMMIAAALGLFGYRRWRQKAKPVA